jgi:hypothetical protein
MYADEGLFTEFYFDNRIAFGKGNYIVFPDRSGLFVDYG